LSLAFRVLGSPGVVKLTWITTTAAGTRLNAVPFNPGILGQHEKRLPLVATDYDEVRSDVAETRNASLEALRSANAPDARSVVRELDEADTSEGVELPGADLSGEELTVTVIPQKEDEFTCYSCFLVRHRSQIAREKAGHKYCMDCEG
jgi:hypothetical protein